MKHIKLASALVVAMGIVATGVASAAASTGGTITFTGAVTDETCTIKGGSGTDGGTGNFTVALDAVPASALAAAGDTAGNKPFQVIIGGSNQPTCQDGKVATMSFETSSRAEPGHRQQHRDHRFPGAVPGHQRWRHRRFGEHRRSLFRGLQLSSAAFPSSVVAATTETLLEVIYDQRNALCHGWLLITRRRVCRS
jgi:hypothetical protein